MNQQFTTNSYLAWSLTFVLGVFSPLLKALPLLTDKEISDNTNISDWLAYGRTHSEQRFSPLDQINLKTVSQLGVEWYLNLPNDVGLVATPLVSDGVHTSL